LRHVPLSAIAAVVLWGGSFVAVDLALATFSPFGLTALRLALGGAVLLSLQRARGGPLLPPGRDLALTAFLGLTLGAHLSIQAYGLLYTSAIHTGWIVGFMPVTIALGAQLFLRQRLRGLGWFGVLLATSGVLLVTLEEPAGLVDARWGDLLQLSTCLTWTVYSLAGVGVVLRNGSLQVAGVSMAVAALVLAPAALGTGWTVGDVDATAVGSLVYLGLFCNAVAFSLWYRAQKKHGAHRTGVTLYLEPFVTLALAIPILGESAGAEVLVGGVIMLVGVHLVGRGSRRPEG
jgi:drug/metabolite transporter (DMT)-like permease